jgi:hypothetical protein
MSCKSPTISLQRDFLAVTPGEKAGHLGGGTIGPVGEQPRLVALRPGANRLDVGTLLLDASHEQQLHGHVRHQELRDVGSRCGDLNVSAGFTPHV